MALVQKIYEQLEKIEIMEENVVTFLNTLRKNIYTFMDKTTYPRIKKLLQKALPQIVTTVSQQEFNYIVDFIISKATPLELSKAELIDLKNMSETIWAQIV